MATATPPPVRVLGVPVHPVDPAALLAAIERFIDERARRTLLYANVHVVNQAVREPLLMAALEAADLVYCDGEGVRLGARVLGARLPARATGADLIWDAAALCERRGFGVAWIGGAPGVAARATQRLVERQPRLRVCAVEHGYFAKQGTETAEVIARVNAAAPELIIVGLGTPEQELWVARNRAALSAPLVWCIGATADFVAGVVPRAPGWMRRNGLEWLYRLAHEPRRLAGRYLLGNPLFLLRVIRQRARGGRPARFTP